MNHEEKKIRVINNGGVPAETRKRQDYLEWSEYFMAVAFLSAQRSKDPNSQENKIVGIGYNGMPNGCDDDLLPWARSADDHLDTKYPYDVVYLSDKYHSTPEMQASRRLLDLAQIPYRQFQPKRNKIVIDFDSITSSFQCERNGRRSANTLNNNNS
ncbi:Deoxycytidylate deaminase [Bagarius yarrelli]|uniref:Deoxycytidylate deaminase n=1 Tax=Bagarius yarrelli TaxID=175774 RepID=A0A556VWM7_BAGYA|nr:Deoxycytidylate deaminase [Bagarius yarrelli]